jgi:hypothetical protein
MSKSDLISFNMSHFHYGVDGQGRGKADFQSYPVRIYSKTMKEKVDERRFVLVMREGEAVLDMH